jgi:4-hydroxybenzoate polyprenyltransferase
MYTLYLFTRADIATFTVPTILFALFGAISGLPLSTSTSPDLFTILTRFPSIILLVLANLLIFDIANQRFPEAVLEDTLNKPSRPLPSGRITTTQSRRLLLLSVPIVLALSYYLGPWQETLLLFSSTWMYNDLKGCDEDFITRNLLIAIGYGLYNSAALRIAYGVDSSHTSLGMYWIILVSCMIFTTEHICDLKDQVGDRARERRSAPIVLGDGVTRWTVAVPIMVWSFACPFFFRLGPWGYVFPVGVGAVVAARTLLLRSMGEDAVTWKIWALWTAVLFSLPLVKENGALMDGAQFITETICMGSGCPDSLNLVGMSSMAILVKSKKLGGYVFGKEGRVNLTMMEAANI